MNPDQGKYRMRGPMLGAFLLRAFRPEWFEKPDTLAATGALARFNILLKINVGTDEVPVIQEIPGNAIDLVREFAKVPENVVWLKVMELAYREYLKYGKKVGAWDIENGGDVEPSEYVLHQAVTMSDTWG